ncbi:hypothetical protein STSO111631_06440 [Stackebrandtia soli]
MPRTRSVLLIGRFGLLFTLFGLLLGVFSLIDLINGKKALTEFVVFAGMFLLGVVLLVSTGMTTKTATAKDWAALPQHIRRDLPYGAQERDGTIGFPLKLSLVVILDILGIGFVVLGVYGFMTEEGAGGVVVLLLMTCLAAVLIAFAWILRGVRWSIDATGVNQTSRSGRRVDWSSVADVHTDPRQRFVGLFGPAGGKPIMRFNIAVMEISALDLAEVLKKGPAILEPPASSSSTSD